MQSTMKRMANSRPAHSVTTNSCRIPRTFWREIPMAHYSGGISSPRGIQPSIRSRSSVRMCSLAGKFNFFSIWVRSKGIFTLRPKNRVQIVFEELSLQKSNKSCFHQSDKITIFDTKIANQSAVLDVFCNERVNETIVSTGSNMLIEFEASAKRTTSFGFKAKYRFVAEDDLDSTYQRRFDTIEMDSTAVAITAENSPTDDSTTTTRDEKQVQASRNCAPGESYSLLNLFNINFHTQNLSPSVSSWIIPIPKNIY